LTNSARISFSLIMASKPPFQRISNAAMREMFNNGKFFEKVQSGILVAVILEDRLAPLTADQPPGTRSQMVSYRTKDGNEVARVHQYLRPDQTIGASGKPDPKRLLVDGILYRLVKGT
jgi:hypothetical protein